MIKWLLRIALIVIWLQPQAASGQVAGSAVVSGRVVDGDGEPLSAVVSIEGTSLREVTDSTGHFIIRGIPAGSHSVVARTIGHHVDVAFVDVSGGDTVHVDLELVPNPPPLSGVSPLPRGPELAAAARLIRDVLQEPEVTALLEELGDPEAMEPFEVWAPWLLIPDTIMVAGASRLRVIRDCLACFSRISSTLEGTRRYTAEFDHIRLAVTSGSSGIARLTFCLRHAEAGEYVPLKCGGGETLRLTYVRRAANDWVRLQR